MQENDLRQLANIIVYEFDYSISDLSIEIGIHRTAISKWLINNYYMTDNNLRKIHKTVSYLIFEGGLNTVYLQKLEHINNLKNKYNGGKENE